MSKTPNPAITRSTVARRESYKKWKQRRDAEEAQQIARAQQEAHRVMDMIDALRPRGAETDVQIEEHSEKPMDQVINKIRHPPLHKVAHHAQPWIAVIGFLLAFFAGLALGAAL